MASVAQTLAIKLEEWAPEVSREVEILVADIIAFADLNVLDLARSRRVEQEVLDLLKAEKKYDAVKAMREIRDEISREIQGMNFEQEREYIEKHLNSGREEERAGVSKQPVRG